MGWGRCITNGGLDVVRQESIRCITGGGFGWTLFEGEVLPTEIVTNTKNELLIVAI